MEIVRAPGSLHQSSVIAGSPASVVTSMNAPTTSSLPSSMTSPMMTPITTIEGSLRSDFAESIETSRHKILVFDPEENSHELIRDCLDESDYELKYCKNREEASRCLFSNEIDVEQFSLTQYDLVLWSLSAPYEDELKSLNSFRDLCPDLRIVLIASQEVLAFAPSIKQVNVEAFLFKPFREFDLRSVIDRALRKPKVSSSHRPSASVTFVNPKQLLSMPQFEQSQEKVVQISERVSERVPEPAPERVVERMKAKPQECGLNLGLIGTSPEMLKVVSLIRKIGKSTVNVLVTGESGTGKEMVAHAIHKVSDRAGKPFIAINCAAIPRELLESELFGHAKGAFTGATTARRGLFEEAHEGTILLDEIGDLPMSLQAKILRLLQTRQVKPLGQNVVREVDVRIISATHKNLKSLIQKGEFREDLYYRLNVMPIHLPPLRERKSDIVLLAEHFLKRYAGRTGIPAPVLTRKACTKLQTLEWKGNVRELENVIERAIVLSDGQQITEDEILTEEMDQPLVSAEDLFNSGMSLKDIEREYIKHVLKKTGNRKEAATKILGIDRKTLYRKEKLYGIRTDSDLEFE